jgi:uncharacterized protein with HEPN domain
MPDERVYLEYIRESISLVQEYAADGENTFLTDPRTQDAILRRMETLADATGKLSDSLKARHADIPWRDITAFRNVLAHAYAEVRLDRVWEAVHDDLPALLRAVDAELREDSS